MKRRTATSILDLARTPDGVRNVVDHGIADYWLNRLLALGEEVKGGMNAHLALFDATSNDATRTGGHAVLQATAQELTKRYSKDALALVLVHEVFLTFGLAPVTAEVRDRFTKDYERLHAELSTWEGLVQLRRQGTRLADWQAAKPKRRGGKAGARATKRTVFRLTEAQELCVLEWMDEHSHSGMRGFQVEQDSLPGIPDLGRAIIHLAEKGLCATEDPDFCQLLHAGSERLFKLRMGGRKPGKPTV
ncbi:MAG TPA: hypothetical protein VD995_03155 [Azospirillum sp.]|nr:hypothetical protein [Azospirillum sp.]